MRKRTVMKSLGITLAAFFSVWSLTAASAHGQTVVSLGHSGAGVSTDLRRLIEKSGLWQKRGLEVRAIYFNSGSLLAQAMLGGNIEVSDSDVPTMLNLGASGVLDIKIIAVTINRLETSLVVRNAIRSTNDLKGKRVAISRFGSASDITTRLVLRFWKLDPDKDLTILQSGNTPTRVAALVAGHVDAGLVSPTQIHLVLASGCCRVLADLSDLPLDYARFGIVVPTSLLKTQRDTLRKLLEAYIEGIYIFKSRPEIALTTLSEGGIKDPQVAKSVYERLAKSLREYPVAEPKGVQAVLDSLPTLKARSAQVRDFIDTSLVEEIQKSGYIGRLYGK